MYHQPTIESLGDSQMSQVSGAFVWSVGPVFVTAAAVFVWLVAWVAEPW
jgi:hypothetical protein